MTRRLMAVLVVLSLLLSATPWEGAWAMELPSGACSTCVSLREHVPSEDTAPFSERCPCLCCHTCSLIPPATLRPASMRAGNPPIVGAQRQGAHSSDFFERIYHPPRLG